MKQLLFFILVIFQLSIQAQTTISGKVTDNKGIAIEGVNVYLKGTYDGTSTDENGNFSFVTNTKGTQTLVASFISYETYSKTASIAAFKNIQIKLRDDVNTLDAVVINAGSFSAGDNAKVTALKPLDVVTTASALGDFIGALQTLPGTSNVSEDGRLFVRGGEADETQIFVDGLRVFTPYSPTSKNSPTRGRFSPFLFKGINFSTGGYSAEYGQALSSVLLLDTNDEAIEEKTDLAFMTLGLGVGNTQIWGKSSLSVNASYINLSPYQSAFPDKNKWNKPFQSMSGETVYRHRFANDGLLKIYGAFSATDFDLVQEDINLVDGFHFGLKNRNLYINTSYKNVLENDWTVFGGVSFTNDHSDINILDDEVTNNENSAHVKIKLKKRYSNRFKLNFGVEYFMTKFDENYSGATSESFDYGYDNNIASAFVETDIFFSKRLASKIGIRGEYSELLDDFSVSPRISVALKSGKNAQFSMAYGQFYQNPKRDYLKFNTNFKAEYTSHLIANYQYVKNRQ
ncbi:MAG: carboxypeptidase-like regulatory domain-containing protein, partial [Flavobacteriaceae bacterium]|nr:carboxypeptidase-like regulatory domain-containing protein [Flavobacteriaceae bacterium]